MTMLADHIRHEHRDIDPHLETMLMTAHAVGEVPIQVLRDMVSVVLQFVLRELVPHAAREDGVLYLAVERAYGAKGSTDAMKREHKEVERYAAQLSDLHGTLVIGHEIQEETLRSLRRVLYGLHAVASLHLAVEEEVYLPLLGDRLDAAAQKDLTGVMDHGRGH